MNWSQQYFKLVLIFAFCIIAPTICLEAFFGLRLKHKGNSPFLSSSSVRGSKIFLNKYRDILVQLSGEKILDDESTPQYRAMNWLMYEDNSETQIEKSLLSLTQRYILAVFYFSTRGETWYNRNDFLMTINECMWNDSGMGVTQCTPDGEIETIHIVGNNLVGSIPPEISHLSKLKEVQLDINNLIGSIPSEIGNLKELEKISLGGNRLSSSIPSQFENLTSLHTLTLAANRLSSSIPYSLGSMLALRQLHLQNNDLTGTIPTSFCNLHDDAHFYAHYNKISGDVQCLCQNDHELQLDNRVFDCEKEVVCDCCKCY